METRKLILATVVAAMGALSMPVAAQGAVTIGGSTSAPGNNTGGCFGMPGPSCTYIQTADPTAVLTAPFDGVIVQWRVRGDSKAAQESLRVVQAAGGTAYTGISTSAPETVVPGIENVFATQLPIRQGQSIGIDVPSATGTPNVETRTVTGATDSTWLPSLADGETRPAFGSSADTSLLLNATIEADCDADGLGDETQDPSLFGGTCPAKDRALVLDTNKSKVRKGKKVTFSGLVSATGDEQGCRANQTVELQRKKPSQSEFTAFAQVQTSSTGSFSLVQKIKKTFEYRAVLAGSAGCNPGASNTETVKAKRKKKQRK